MFTHRPRPGGRTTPAALVAALITLGGTQPALAATAVFGGTTNAHEAIVVRADGKARKLRSLVIAWEAPCTDGTRFAEAIELAPAARSSVPRPHDLLIDRNRGGRFAGAHVVGYSAGPRNAAVAVETSGRLQPRRAAGTLSASVTLLDSATGVQQATCKTGTLEWTAGRSPGRIYGGKTAQDEPIVVRLDRRRTTVADVHVGWQSASCQPPDNFVRLADRLTDFPLRKGRFGDTWEQSFDLAGGAKASLSYAVRGRLARTSSRGMLQVTVKETDAAGAVTMACDSGAVRWRAATG